MKGSSLGIFIFVFHALLSSDKHEVIRSSRLGFLEDYTRSEQAAMMNARPILYPSDGVVIVRPPLMGFARDTNRLEEMIMSHEERIVLRKTFVCVEKSTGVRMSLCIKKLKEAIQASCKDQSLYDLHLKIKRQKSDDRASILAFLKKDKKIPVLSEDAVVSMQEQRDRVYQKSIANVALFLAKMKYKKHFTKSLESDVYDASLSLYALKKIALSDASVLTTSVEHHYEDIKDPIKKVLACCALALLFEDSLRKSSDARAFFLRD